MSVEIVALERGGVVPLVRFRIEDEMRVEDIDWRLLEPSIRPLEIYFCYFGTAALHHDRILLQDLVQRANNFAAGARTHIVLDRRTFSKLNLEWALDSVDLWFRRAEEGEIDDILEGNLDGMTPCVGKVEPLLLRQAADRSYRREKLWATMGHADGWVAVFENPDSDLATFVTPYLLPSTMSSSSRHLVMVEESHSEVQRSVVEMWSERHSVDAAIVATVSYEHKQALRDLCKEKDLERLRLRGPYELRYFLSQLNRRRQAGRYDQVNRDGSISWTG